MPGIITHHLFGEETYASLAPTIGESDVQHDAFLLGNQGPDPLLCLKVLPVTVPYRTIGTVMHEQKPAALLGAMHRRFIYAPRFRSAPACKAYALGFLCHYLLDSTVHPLVYAQQFALRDGGVEGLSPMRKGSEIHALIETELDEHLLAKKLGATVATFVPHREILGCAPEVLIAISTRLAPVSERIYGIALPQLAFASSVKMYRAAQAALDSKRDGARRYIDYARLVGKEYLRIQAMTHSATPNPDPAFANSDHSAWPHPFEDGKTVNASFDELYETALDAALSTIPRFAQADFSAADCEALTRNANFKGERV